MTGTEHLIYSVPAISLYNKFEENNKVPATKRTAQSGEFPVNLQILHSAENNKSERLSNEHRLGIRIIIVWWAFRDLNPGPSGYEPDALTN